MTTSVARLSVAPAPWPQPTATEPRLLHEFFARAAQLHPDRIAIDVPPATTRPERQLLTYAQLQRQVDALAETLRNLVAEDAVVAILLPRAGAPLYIAQLAALQAGAAYTCIDPAFPDEQLQSILDDAQPVAILTDETGFDRCRRVRHTAEGVLNVLDWLD